LTTAASGAEIMASTVAPAGSTAPAAPAGSAAAVVVSTAVAVVCMAAEAATGAADTGNSLELSNRAQERLAANAVSRFSLCGSFSLQLETIQSRSP
jgi:hypothetical protein